VRLDPDLAEAHNNLGMILVQLGRPQEAIPHFAETLRLKPEYVEGHISLGMALAATGQSREAIAQFEETLRAKPDSLSAYTHLAKAYADMGDLPRAISAGRQALSLARAQQRSAEAAQIESWLDILGRGVTTTPQPPAK
jgi:tetratricopeptide (TPR) repeat protein